MNPRGDRPLVIVLAVAAFLAPLLTAGATALFFLSRQQDDRIGSLRRELTTMRQANERLFGQLANETAAKNQVSAKLTALEVRVSSVDRQLEETNAKLAASQRALRWQKRAAQKARQQARAARPKRLAVSSP